MKKTSLLIRTLVLFLAVAAMADEIDAEIVKNLDFYQAIPVLEDMDLIELHAQTEDTDGQAAQPASVQKEASHGNKPNTQQN